MTSLKSIFFAIFVATASLKAADPLPSWNEGAVKQTLVNFIRTTTDKASRDYIPPEERIATFDQDGTLWVEQPLYTQVVYCLDRVPQIVEAKPELKNEEPFKTVLSENWEAIAKLTTQDLEKIAIATLSGMSTDQFQDDVKQWIATAKNKRWNRPYTELIYQPMLELLQYFRANGYKTYIVTGGGQDFVRVYAEQTYGIPIEQVVGTAGGTKFVYDKNGKPILIKEPKLLLNDNYAGKAEGIHLMIGRRPSAAFGNSIGDQEMLEYTKAGAGARLAMLVLHDDAKREYAYGPAEGLPDSKIGTFTQALYDEAKKNDWTVISMKNDWKQIFKLEQGEQVVHAHPVTAIDIALEPDARMIEKATAANERLLKVFPKGFSLNKTHKPHITMLQRYVRTADLEKVYSAISKVLENEKPASWQLKAFKYHYYPWKDIGLAGISVRPTDNLLNLQQKVIDAVAPFTVKTGTAAAFFTTAEDREINQPTFEYVETFVPKASGKNYIPHVTIGLATQDYLNKMVEEPFDEFTFSPAAMSVYQLGNYGTARQKLKMFEFAP